MPTALSTRLASAVSAAGFGKERPRAVADLHRLLVERHGVRCTRTALDHWLIGKRVPTLAHLVALLDALSVVGFQRDEIVRLALDPEGIALAGPNRPAEDDVPTVTE